MSQEILNAAIMQLRAKALEAYGVIKDIYQRPSAEGDADKIAALSLKLAQLEGGMLTLQQYAPEIILSASAVATEAAIKEEEQSTTVDEEEEEVSAPEPAITEEDLAARSPTYRRTRRSKKKDKS